VRRQYQQAQSLVAVLGARAIRGGAEITQQRRDHLGRVGVLAQAAAFHELADLGAQLSQRTARGSRKVEIGEADERGADLRDGRQRACVLRVARSERLADDLGD
jgi:hypothetical protein